MALSKIKIGKLITLNNIKNTDGLDLPFYGINKDKEFMPTVAATDSLDSKTYKIMTKGRFVFSGMQTGRDKCIRIGLYENEFDALISPAYTTFEVTSNEILPEYLFMIFKSSEMDRYGAFLSDGSIRSNLDWDVFCNIELEIPSIDIQRKYVAVYKALLHNLEVYQSKLDDIKFVCDAYVEDLRRNMACEKLGKYLRQSMDVNRDRFNVDSVRGISIKKEFIYTKADMTNVSLNPYLVVRPNYFAYVPITSRNGDKISLALNTSQETYIVSSSYLVFYITDIQKLSPKYLFLFLSRSEFDRYARYNSWGSAREAFEWDALGDLEIPIPDIKIQNSIVSIHNSLTKRMEIVERLKILINDICPILVNGAIKEGGAQ